MARQVTPEDAYAEACKALGEAIVMQRLMNAELLRLAAQDAVPTATTNERRP